ncbi:MAG: hypothetical protein KBF21_17780 [Thermoanaerobaculia bacterium]|jgi:hypothetical protein|nr:hypothetical protein [Thermoanaerobaculia bacterium]MBP9826083.1 hypothetical protein [Thermoanaerobaculia bacterium]
MVRLPRPIKVSTLVTCLLFVGLAARSDGGAFESACTGDPVPAATLLIPYFEIDLADTNGKTTLISVTNAGGQATLAHLVLWTDWGLPTLAFDLFLAANDVQSVNLRDLFAGALPVTGGGSFAGCTNPLVLPTLDDAALEALRRQHTGQPDGQQRCAGSGRAGANIALGYLTIDVVQACSPTIHFPTSNGYFEAGGSGIAANDNVLLGDFFLVDAAANLAQGGEAAHIVADEARFGGRTQTFYSRWIDRTGEDARAPLGTQYRARFLNGGLFSGGTDLAVWAEPSLALPAAVLCDEREESVDVCQLLSYSVFDEAGAGQELPTEALVTEVTARIPVGGTEIPTAIQFGFVDVANRELRGCDFSIGQPPIQVVPLQSYVVALHSASGRFAVGFNAARTRDELCQAP